jgi:hypothetical protein
VERILCFGHAQNPWAELGAKPSQAPHRLLRSYAHKYERELLIEITSNSLAKFGLERKFFYQEFWPGIYGPVDPGSLPEIDR